MGKLLRVAQITLVVLFAAAGLVLVAFSLPFTGWKALSVQTGSMQPAIPPGSLVFVHRVPPDLLQPGDVITYRSKTSAVTITHRIVERSGLPKGPKKTIVKGDANKTADAPVYDNQIVGQVTASVPYVGKGLDFLKTPLGLVLFVYLPAVLIFASEIRLLVRRLTKLELAKHQAAASKEPATAEAVALPEPAKKTIKRAVVSGAFVLLAGTLCASFALPTLAELEGDATLTGNSISTAAAPPPSGGPHVIIQRVTFPLEKHKNRRHHWEWRQGPSEVQLYSSSGWHNADITDWTLQNHRGVLYHFKNNRHGNDHTREVTLTFWPVLNTHGDGIQLKDADGHMVDAVSWGSNTNYLSPSIQGIDPGKFIRRIKHIDTDAAADWRIKQL